MEREIILLVGYTKKGERLDPLIPHNREKNKELNVLITNKLVIEKIWKQAREILQTLNLYTE